jgi:hypothetical protein
MRLRVEFAAAFALAGCAHAPPVRSDVYVNSERYINRLVSVCGYIVDSANMVESSDREDRTRSGGLSIINKGPLKPLYRGRTCVEGKIVQLGCASGPRICLEAIFDYAIEIHRVISPSTAR